MKHLVMVKWNETVKDKDAMAAEVLELFQKAKQHPEIQGIEHIKNAVPLPNRWDSLFIIYLKKEDIQVWIDCKPHQIWKKDYNKFVDKKAVFDWE